MPTIVNDVLEASQRRMRLPLRSPQGPRTHTLFWRCLAVMLALSGGIAQPAERAPDARIALVIGNGAYQSGPLKNPVQDARAMTRALQQVGFEVLVRENLSQQGFMEVLREFGKRLKDTGGVGLFYYAGHGMQVKGANYLIPVDAAIQAEDEVRYLAIDANQVLDKMEQAGNRLNIVILDACRDNPFARSFRSKQSGLAQMDAPSGTLIAFATAPGAVAYDGDGDNGVYTKHLLRNLSIPGLPVELVLKRVREGVSKETAQKQVPWESSSLLGDFYFKGDATAAAPAATADSTAVELAFWDSVKDSGIAAEYAAYLKSYPQGRFAALAEARMSAAKPQPRPSSPAAAAAPAQVALAQPGGMSKPRSIAAKVGDNWTYSLIENGKRQVDMVTVAITAVDGDQVQEAVNRVAVRQSATTRTFSARFDPQAAFQEVELPGKYLLVEFSPYFLIAEPPRTGTEWSSPEADLTLDKAAAQRVRTRMSVRVLGQERIQVPAGEFTATRIEARSATGTAADRDVVYTYWYSADVRRTIKISRRQLGAGGGKGSEETLELLGFQQTR